MMTLFARGGSLAALAAMLALASPAVPAAAQDMLQVQPDEPVAAPERPDRVEISGGPAQVEFPRTERDAPRFEQAETRPAYTPPAYSPQAYTPPTRIDPDSEANAVLAQRQRGERRGRGGFDGGFGGAIGTGDQNAQPAPPAFPRTDRTERRGWRGGEVRGDADTWRGQRGDDRNRGWRRDQVPPARQNGWLGLPGDGVADRRDGVITGRTDAWQREGRQGDWQNRDRSDWRDGNRSGWRNDRRDGWRGNDWRDGRRNDWRRDGWRDDDRRRGDWRRGDGRNWRRDDWRWGWNGRPGWDNRDFRRWDNRWRSNRSYDWFDFRRSNRFVFQPGPYFAPFRSHRYNRLSIGLFLDSLFFQPRFFINDPWTYRLPPAYGPYQWVRYYDDVVLVDIYTGEVVDVIHDFFW